MHHALAAGAIVPVEELPTAADGLAGNLEAGAITFPIVRACVQRIALVEERSIEAAIRGFLDEEHQVVEPSGAVAAAALLEGCRAPAAKTIAIVASGRNLDPALLRRLVSH
jgi:threonine dehydratase